MGNKTAQKPEFGYDWKPANKRKPRCNEVLKLRRIEEGIKSDPMEHLAMWDGKGFYIFDPHRVKWLTLEEIVYPESMLRDAANVPNAKLVANLLEWEYAYIPKALSKYIPFHAIAMAKRSEVIGASTKTGIF